MFLAKNSIAGHFVLYKETAAVHNNGSLYLSNNCNLLLPGS